MLGKPLNLFRLDKKKKLLTPDPQAEIRPQPESIGATSTPTPRKKWGWLWLWLLTGSLLGGVGILAFWWLATPPPSPNCEKISPLSTDMERLLCAQESAQSGELPKILAGMDQLSQWTPDHPLYREAQRLIADWSTPVLAAARRRIEGSDLRGAVELASRIPKTSPVYKEAQASMAEWKTVWRQGEAIAMAARKAMKAQDWVAADLKIAELRQFPQDYWRYERSTILSQLLTAERQGRQWVAQARAIAQAGQSDQLAAAIALISQVDTKTYAWSDAQPSLAQWSEILLSQGTQSWVAGNLDQSMALATWVLPNPNLKQTAQELLWLSQARKHAFASSTTLKPTPTQLWNLSAAIATAQLIQPESRYYSTAQENVKSWLAQFQDLTLLQVAYGLGEMQSAPALQLAAWQGTQVTPDRPRRAQAQTLVAYWQREIRSLEDRPTLAYARKLAEPGTIPALESAIAQASRISFKRPLRQEAQTLIANWTGQIQTIADQPILDQAQALAQQGQLNAAILAASGIQPGRSLYGQAQAAIGSWQAQIRATELAQERAKQVALNKRRHLDSNDFDAPQTEPETGEGSSPAPPNESPSLFPTPHGLYPSPPAGSAGATPGAPSIVVPTEPFPAPVNEPPPPPTNPTSPPLYETYPPPSRTR